jgi:MATE family multidrug resistance protein
MIVSVLTFIGISIYLTRIFDNHGIWFSLALFMVLRSLTLQFYFKKILKKF